MSYECRKFEFAGILCGHILKVFCVRSISKVPEKYILKRWTKDVRKGGNRVSIEAPITADPKEMIGRRYRQLCRKSTRLFTRAAEFEEIYTIVDKGLSNWLRELDLNSARKPPQSSYGSLHGVGSVPTHNNVVCINGVEKKVKGIKVKLKSGNQSTRPRRALENVVNKKRAKKKKTLCENNVHNPMVHDTKRVPVHPNPTHLTQVCLNFM